MNKPVNVSEVAMTRCDRRGAHGTTDVLAVEEPLEIRLGKQRLVVLMRTPGDDFDLATGFLLSEGLIERPEQIERMSYCPNVPTQDHGNVLVVETAGIAQPAASQRLFYAGSGCGICGKTGIESVALATRPLSSDIVVADSMLHAMAEKLAQAQIGFRATGGLHAAGIFDTSGRLLCAREDIGRHNAVDKVIGGLAMDDLQPRFPLGREILVVSSRASFEICQKAAIASISIVAAMSAPSSLAASLAQRLNMTLIGFLRNDRCNIYSGPSRISLSRNQEISPAESVLR